MEGFLQHFPSTIRMRVTMKQLKNFLIVSNRQACLVRDILDKKVLFRAIEGVIYSPRKDRDFDKICGKVFEVLSKKQGWHGYLALKNIFHSVRKSSPDLEFLRVALTDVLRRLLKLNVLEIRHCMLPIVNLTTNTLTKQSIAHVNRSGDGVNRSPRAASITQVQQKRLATDQYFGMRQRHRFDATELDEQLPNLHHMNESRAKNKSKSAIGKDVTRYFSKN